MQPVGGTTAPPVLRQPLVFCLQSWAVRWAQESPCASLPASAHTWGFFKVCGRRMSCYKRVLDFFQISYKKNLVF